MISVWCGTMTSTSASSQHPPQGLVWGVKQSFMGYLSMLDDAEIALSDTVELLEGSVLCFATEGVDVDPKDGTGNLRFTGTAVLSGHGGMMRVELRDPQIRLRSDGADLTVGEPSGGEGRLTLATLGDAGFERSEDDLLWSALRVRLLADGVPLFGGQYAAGQPLDPVYVRIPLD